MKGFVLMLLWALANVLSISGQGSVETLEFGRYDFVSTNFAVAVVKSGEGWVQLQVSSDLKTWTERGNILTANSSYLFIDVNAREAPQRFYRWRAPGVSIAEGRARWQATAPAQYSFRLRLVELRTASNRAQHAIVTIRNGTKTVTEITDVLDPENPGAGEFPSIEELFSLAGETFTANDFTVLHINYNLDEGFPSYVLIRRSGELLQYWVDQWKEL
jgi:hypothetical protein